MLESRITAGDLDNGFAMTINDYLFRGGIDELDPDVAELIRHEAARQQKKLILIPSESTVPYAVRNALSSSFHNLYAEGYPLDNARRMTQAEILDYESRLPEFRRNADQRYYKGTEVREYSGIACTAACS